MVKRIHHGATENTESKCPGISSYLYLCGLRVSVVK